MTAPQRYTWAWIAWLLGFLLIEIPAAANGHPDDTLSEHVWRRWFPKWWQRVGVGLFLLALLLHLTAGFSVVPVAILGAWMGVAIIAVEIRQRGGWFVGLKDRVAKWFLSSWLTDKVKGARKGGSAVLKLLDGNKRLIVVLGFVISGLIAAFTGNDVSQWLAVILSAFGWTNVTDIEVAQTIATQAVPMLVAIWAAAHALWKMVKQYKAGATMPQLNSPVGVVKAAAADGSLKISNDDVSNPVVLKVEGIKIATPTK